MTAPPPSKRFADPLEGVEQPAVATSGAEAKAVLRRHRVDRAWGAEIDAVRESLTAAERF